MKKKKDGQVSGCMGYHELFGIIMLILATILTLITCSSLGIVAMFIVGAVMCCHRFVFCPKDDDSLHCNTSLHELMCDTLDDDYEHHTKVRRGKAKKAKS